MTRRMVGLVLVLMSQTGCRLFEPLAGDVRLLRSRVSLLNRRVGQLEHDAGVTSDFSAASSSFSSSSIGASGAAPSIESYDLESSVPSASARSGWRWPYWSVSRKAWGKLGRGVTNIITGWVELPKRVHETSQRSGAGAGLTVGVLRGFGYGFVRTAAGVYETLTFPVPAPPEYRPLLHPAYVFTCEQDETAR